MIRSGWSDPVIESNSFLKAISKIMSRKVNENPENFPDIRSSEYLLIFSDYSGEGKKDSHFSISVLVMGSDDWKEWESGRQIWRRRYLSDGRRMSHKNLSDIQKSLALTPFFELLDQTSGFLITIGIQKNFDYIVNEIPIDLDNRFFSEYRIWSPKVLQKMVIVSNLISLFVSGFGAKGQNLIWISDQDSMFANETRLGGATKLFSSILAGYLSFDLGHIRVGTTKSDPGDQQLEDLVAVADLAAGTFCERLNSAEKSPLSGDFLPLFAPDLTARSAKINQWLCGSGSNLRKYFFKVDRTGPQNSTTSLFALE
ncbi:hypothetical protein [Minwuia sp.]|uniref:hypothetical protein n=1 Tax=Minwuia sp. TaxID=2493630 RepID=UPI003A94D9E5